MATAIRVIPTLHGEEAKRFEENAKWVEAHPGREDYSKQCKIVREYLRKINLV